MVYLMICLDGLSCLIVYLFVVVVCFVLGLVDFVSCGGGWFGGFGFLIRYFGDSRVGVWFWRIVYVVFAYLIVWRCGIVFSLVLV